MAVKAFCTVQGASFSSTGDPYLVCRIDADSGQAGNSLYAMSTPSTPMSVAIVGLSAWAKEYAEENLNVTFGTLDTVRLFGVSEL